MSDILEEFGIKFLYNPEYIFESSRWFPSCGHFLLMEVSIAEMLLLSVNFQNKPLVF